jgi:hypothetical protein
MTADQVSIIAIAIIGILATFAADTHNKRRMK